MPACSIAAWLPSVPTTAISHPGHRDCRAEMAPCRCRPERSNRMRVGRVLSDAPEPLDAIEHLCGPALEHEQRPDAAPDRVVAAIEAIDELRRHAGVEQP